MDIGLLVKIDVVLGGLSLLCFLQAVLGETASLWRFKRMKEDSKHILREIKGELTKLLAKKEMPMVEEEDDDEDIRPEVTPDDHVTVQKILRKVELLLKSSDFENAEKLLVSALGYNPDDEDTKILLAFVYMKRRKFGKAESLYLDLVENKSEDPSVFSNLGKVLEAQEKHETAEKAFIEALKRDMYEPGRHAQLAKLYMKMERIDDAVRSFEEAVRLDTRNVDFLFHLARSYELLGKFMLSGDVYNRILDIEPYNEKAKVSVLDLKEKGYISSSM